MGLFICFVLPGIIAGLLLGYGAKPSVRAKEQRVQVPQKGQRGCTRATPQTPTDKHRLYVYDLREDYRTVA